MLFLGEEFYLINALGLAVLIMGVFWFNYLKYKKVAAGEIKPSKSANLEPYKDEDTPDMVSCTESACQHHCCSSAYFVHKVRFSAGQVVHCPCGRHCSFVC